MKDSRLFNSVKEQVDKFDAYALLEGGCPDDEFDIESALIAGRIFKGMGVAKIAEIMADVMNSQFGNTADPDDRPFNAEEFSDAAQKIKKVLDSL